MESLNATPHSHGGARAESPTHRHGDTEGEERRRADSLEKGTATTSPLVRDGVPPGPLRYGKADDAICALAARQPGIVTRRQVLALGVSAGVLDRRIGSPLFRTIHRGVYLVGPILPQKGRALAAVLACGAHARVSHDSASALWRSRPDPRGFLPIREIPWPSMDPTPST